MLEIFCEKMLIQIEVIWSRNRIIAKKVTEVENKTLKTDDLVEKKTYNEDKTELDTKRKSVKGKMLDKADFARKTNKKEFKKEIPKTDALVKKTTYNTDMNILKSKIINVEGELSKTDGAVKKSDLLSTVTKTRRVCQIQIYRRKVLSRISTHSTHLSRDLIISLLEKQLMLNP